MAHHIVITGPMGCGKTAAGKALARARQIRFRDSDDVLLAGTGRNAREIAAADGVPDLHDLERQFVVDSIAAAGATVIAAAASIADDPRLLNRIVADGHTLVMLDVAAPERGLQYPSEHRRPVGEQEARQLHVTRLRAAVRAGAVIIDADRDTDEIVASVVELLDGATPQSSS